MDAIIIDFEQYEVRNKDVIYKLTAQEVLHITLILQGALVRHITEKKQGGV